MGTITPRTSADGTLRYKAELRIRRKGQIVHQETQTFDREKAAKAWVKKRETELAAPGAIAQVRAGDPTLGAAITRYIEGQRIPLKGDKLSVLNMIAASELGELACSEVDSAALYAYGEKLSKRLAPSTVNGYFSYLDTVFGVAQLIWKYPLDVAQIKSARYALRHMGLTGQSAKRDRRPTLDELDRLLAYLRQRHLWYKGAMPMDRIVLAAIFSARRLGELARLEWSHIDVRRSKIRVFDMKDPKKKIGNHVWVDITPEGMRVLQAMPRTGDRIFPYTVSSMSDAFKEARVECSVDDLTFHDLRHEGVSRLFEMGYSIPEVSAMSGHKTWENLKRYTHLEQRGDKFAGWQWLDVIAPLPQLPLGQLTPQS